MRYYSSSTGEMVLQGAITAGDTTITVSTTAGLPVAYPYTLFLDYGSATEEIVDVTAAAGSALTVVRGRDGSVAQAHAFGAKIRHGLSARDLRESRDHEAATAAHGVTTVVGANETQTLDNKTFQPTGDHAAVKVRTVAANTAPAVDIRDEADSRRAAWYETGLEFLSGSNAVSRLRQGAAVSLFKSIFELRVSDDIHAVVGNVTGTPTGRFIRLWNGVTELFSVAANGDLAARAGTFASSVGVTGDVNASGNVAATGNVTGTNITSMNTAIGTNATNITTANGRITTLENYNNGLTPTVTGTPVVLTGVTTHTLSAASWGSRSVSFPQPFAASSTPVVVASVEFSGGPKVCGVYNITNTGFTVGVGDRDSTPISGTYTIQWVAIGTR